MSSANFKLKRTAAASRGFLATARFSCYSISVFQYPIPELILKYSWQLSFNLSELQACNILRILLFNLINLLNTLDIALACIS